MRTRRTTLPRRSSLRMPKESKTSCTSLSLSTSFVVSSATLKTTTRKSKTFHCQPSLIKGDLGWEDVAGSWRCACIMTVYYI